jgi:hypothetical protein
MRKLDVKGNVEGTTARDGKYSRTVSWPKLVEIKSNIRNECLGLGKLVFGSGVLRPSVKRLECDLKHLLSLGSNEVHLLLGNFPNLTHLELQVKSGEVGLFRSIMRMLPTSCSKIQSLQLLASFPLRDEDVLGVDEEG